MNILPHDRQIAVIAALTEGNSIRATERLTGIHRDTIMRLGARIGAGCAALHDMLMRDLHAPIIEMDELWSFVGKKQKRLKPEDGADKGDQYVFIALDAINKAILSYRVGKRDGETTREFVADLRSRILNAPQISTDGYEPYVGAIAAAFGEDVHYGQIVKHFRGEPPINAARRYSPGWVVGVSKRRVAGFPPDMLISTSYAERQNLTVRMQTRRFTRLTNGFSKKLDNHVAAVALYVAHYNLCRVHETLRITPGMAMGVAGRVWTISDLIRAAEEAAARDNGDEGPVVPPPPPPARPALRMIRGGLA